MPTVATSSQVSDAVYIASVVALSLLLARPVYLVFSASQERGAEAVSSSLGRMIDSMSPGVTLVTGLETYPGVQLSVTLSGNTVAATFGRTTVTTEVRWELPRATLSPGEKYAFTLIGGELLVEKAGSD